MHHPIRRDELPAPRRVRQIAAPVEEPRPALETHVGQRDLDERLHQGRGIEGAAPEGSMLVSKYRTTLSRVPSSRAAGSNDVSTTASRGASSAESRPGTSVVCATTNRRSVPLRLMTT